MDSHLPADDLRNAFKLLGHSLPETEEEAAAFIAEYDSGEIEHPTIPEHLSPPVIVAAIRSGREPSPEAENILNFPRPSSGLSGLRIAARNGEGPLSEETLRKMKEAQED